jgi:hypothetical protein
MVTLQKNTSFRLRMVIYLAFIVWHGSEGKRGSE